MPRMQSEPSKDEIKGYQLLKELAFENKTLTSDMFHAKAINSSLSSEVSRAISSLMFRKARADGLIRKTNKCVEVKYKTEHSQSSGIRPVWESLVWQGRAAQ